MSAFAQLLDLVRQPQDSRAARPHEFGFYNEAFRSIHSFLTHASNVSKILWPAAPKKKKNESNDVYQLRIGTVDKISRSRHLRARLNLPENHLLKNRTLRDHLEHFDERLDHWQKSSEHHGLVDIIIGPRTMITGIARSDIMRWLDPVTMDLFFLGDAFNLQEIATGIREMKNNAVLLQEELSKHYARSTC